LRFDPSFLISKIEARAASRDFESFVSHLQPRAVDWIIDVGAGNGWITSKVADRCGTVLAIQPDSKKAGHMQRCYPRVNCVLAVGEAIPIRSSFFEKAYARNSSHHLANQRQALRELYRILKPAGALLIHELNPKSRLKFIEWIERKISRSHVDFLTPDELKRFLEEEGFSIDFLENKAIRYYVLTSK
jgi:ubiquinone/menaquinone biosynthesis C-methylase UbiE